MPVSRQDDSRRPDIPVIVGESPAIEAVRASIAAAARTDAKVLIVGETGVGKDLVAQLIHAQSARAGHPYIPVNCGGIPDTLLESELFGHKRGSFTGAFRDKPGLVRQAERGTLFLDELGEMSPRMQAVLLRFTETGEIQPIGMDAPIWCSDIRIISATNRDLRGQIADGTFREDLYYRLNVMEIVVPSLRDRAEDVPLLLDYYVERAARTHGGRVPTWTRDVAQVLASYPWPGNIRELRSLAERLVARDSSQPVTPDDLPFEIRGACGIGTSVGAALPGNGSDSPVSTPESDRVQRLWDRMAAGEDFWTVVHQPFKAREVTRADLAALVDRGLRKTNGSYRALLEIFGLSPHEYKRFHSFLYEQQCNLSVAPYRLARSSRPQPAEPNVEAPLVVDPSPGLTRDS